MAVVFLPRQHHAPYNPGLCPAAAQKRSALQQSLHSIRFRFRTGTKFEFFVHFLRKTRVFRRKSFMNRSSKRFQQQKFCGIMPLVRGADRCCAQKKHRRKTAPQTKLPERHRRKTALQRKLSEKLSVKLQDSFHRCTEGIAKCRYAAASEGIRERRMRQECPIRLRSKTGRKRTKLR